MNDKVLSDEQYAANLLCGGEGIGDDECDCRNRLLQALQSGELIRRERLLKVILVEDLPTVDQIIDAMDSINYSDYELTGEPTCALGELLNGKNIQRIAQTIHELMMSKVEVRK